MDAADKFMIVASLSGTAAVILYANYGYVCTPIVLGIASLICMGKAAHEEAEVVAFGLVGWIVVTKRQKKSLEEELRHRMKKHIDEGSELQHALEAAKEIAGEQNA